MKQLYPRESDGKIAAATVIRALRGQHYEVFIQYGNDAFTGPLDEHGSVWVITVPPGHAHALMHELAHIFLYANGYPVFGKSPAEVLSDIISSDDMVAVHMLFNLIADVAVESLLKDWGYQLEEGDYAVFVDSDRTAAGLILLYAFGKVSDEELETYFPEKSWQNKLAHQLKEVYGSTNPIEDKLEHLLEILNEYLPFKVTKELEIVR